MIGLITNSQPMSERRRVFISKESGTLSVRAPALSCSLSPFYSLTLSSALCDNKESDINAKRSDTTLPLARNYLRSRHKQQQQQQQNATPGGQATAQAWILGCIVEGISPGCGN